MWKIDLSCITKMCSFSPGQSTGGQQLSVLSLYVAINLNQYSQCYRLSKRLNCFRGTCSGLETWWMRCTTGALSGMRHIVSNLPLPLIASVVVLLNGGVNPMTHALSMTPVSVPVPVPFPQLSPHVCSYRPIIPSPCALGQQVITLLSCLLSCCALYPYHPDHS